MLAVGIASHDEEQVREAIDHLKGVGVILGEARSDYAALHPAHRRACEV